MNDLEVFVESFFSLWEILFYDEGDVIDTFLALPISMLPRVKTLDELGSWTVGEVLYGFPDAGEYFFLPKYLVSELLQIILREYDRRKTNLRVSQMLPSKRLHFYQKHFEKEFEALQKKLKDEGPV